MTDKEAFERIMELMGMEAVKGRDVDGKTLTIYKDTKNNTDKFTTIGYDEFYAGALFDEQGKIIKGYIDSHVAHESRNCQELDDMYDA